MTTHVLATLSNTSPTLLSPNGVHSGVNVSVQNVSASGYIFLGDENVTTSSYGFRILPNHSISFELPSKDHLYITASTSGLTAAVITTGLESKD